MVSSIGARNEAHTSRRAWTAVVTLAIVGTLNYADRNLPSVLAEPIRLDLSLSDTAIGLINGFGFLVVYAVVGIPISRIADRGRYGTVIASSMTLWGLMTMVGGAAQSGGQLALTRVGVAVGEAGGMPTAHAYVARNFAPEKRTVPLAVVALAVPLASLVGLLGGGLLADALGWRAAFVVMGAVSLLVAPVALKVLGPRQSVDAGSATRATMLVDLVALAKRPCFLLIVLGSACVSVAGYAIAVFAPAYLMRARYVAGAGGISLRHRKQRRGNHQPAGGGSGRRSTGAS